MVLGFHSCRQVINRAFDGNPVQRHIFHFPYIVFFHRRRELDAILG